MKSIVKVLVVAGLALSAGFAVTMTSVNAASVYDQVKPTELSFTVDSNQTYTLEEMLNYALQDEYLAQAEYQAIIDNFGDVRPFTNVVNAEQNHIDALLKLFAEYGYTIPANDTATNAIVPDSITSALSTAVEAEKANIAMYNTFLAQDNLPADVRLVFQNLANASEGHLNAFSHDHYAYYGQDMMNQIRNRFQKAFKGSENGQSQSQNQLQYKYQGANASQGQRGSGQAYAGENGNNGNCPND